MNHQETPTTEIFQYHPGKDTRMLAAVLVMLNLCWILLATSFGRVAAADVASVLSPGIAARTPASFQLPFDRGEGVGYPY